MFSPQLRQLVLQSRHNTRFVCQLTLQFFVVSKTAVSVEQTTRTAVSVEQTTQTAVSVEQTTQTTVSVEQTTDSVAVSVEQTTQTSGVSITAAHNA